MKICSVAALVVSLAMVLIGASSAMAESTQLCKIDPGANSCVRSISVHEVSVGKAKLLASPEVQCNVLFSSTSVGEAAGPQIIKGHFTYTNCGCNRVKEKSGTTAEIKVLRLSHETADVTGSAEIIVECFGIECTYNGTGLKGTAKGPLLSTEANGEVILSEQEVSGSGFFCPSKGKLDIKTTPLTAIYIAGEGTKTQLCKKDPGLGETVPCPAGEAVISSTIEEKVNSVHEVSVGKAKLLASPEVQCNVLFSSTSVGEAAGPQIIKGHFTYTNCGCTVEEKFGTTAEIKVLRLSHETADVTGSAEIIVECFGIECTYNGIGLLGTAKGPLLSTEANGEVNLSEQVVSGEGFFCPLKGKLDIKTSPLSAVYLGGEENGPKVLGATLMEVGETQKITIDNPSKENFTVEGEEWETLYLEGVGSSCLGIVGPSSSCSNRELKCLKKSEKTYTAYTSVGTASIKITCD